MLIPRFTIRSMLVITTVCALLASTVYWARAGAAWAAAIASAGGLICLAFFLYGSLFAIAFGLARLRPKGNSAQDVSGTRSRRPE